MIDGLLILLGMLGLAALVIGGITLIGAVSREGRRESEARARHEHQKTMARLHLNSMRVRAQCTASREGIMTKAEVRRAMDWGWDQEQERLRQADRETWTREDAEREEIQRQFEELVNGR